MTSHAPLRAVAVCATKSAFTHTIVSPTCAETCAGANASFSALISITSARAEPAARASSNAPRVGPASARRTDTILLEVRSDLLGVLLMALENLQPGRQQVLELGVG